MDSLRDRFVGRFGKRVKEIYTITQDEADFIASDEEVDLAQQVLAGVVRPEDVKRGIIPPGKGGGGLVIPFGLPRHPRAVMEIGMYKLSGSGVHTIKFKHKWRYEPFMVHSHLGRWKISIPWFTIGTFKIGISGVGEWKIPYPSGFKWWEISLPMPVFTLSHDEDEIEVLLVLGTTRFCYAADGDVTRRANRIGKDRDGLVFRRPGK